jgi:hypothetical protein
MGVNVTEMKMSAFASVCPWYVHTWIAKVLHIYTVQCMYIVPEPMYDFSVKSASFLQFDYQSTLTFVKL